MDFETTISKVHARDIWQKYIKAVKEYNLIENGDVIAVCVSGGKDSMLLAKLLHMTEKYKLFDIKVKYIMMDPGYDEKWLSVVKNNADILGIPLEVFKTKVFDDVDDIGENPCFFCSRMRRGFLYRKAKELGCNKIALGHHYNDVVETILMGMLYGAQVQTMLPMLSSDNVEGMKLIRPMYLIKEQSVINWRDENSLSFVKCACRLATDNGEELTARLKCRRLIQELMKDNPHIEENIFGSVMNVNLHKIMGWQIDKEHHDFRELL